MANFKDFLEIFSQGRVSTGHLVIIVLFGVIGLVVLGPYFALFLFPPPQRLQWPDLLPHYWNQMVTNDAPGVALFFAGSFIFGLAFFCVQLVTTKFLWSRVVKPLAGRVFGLGADSRAIDKHLITSSRFSDRTRYFQVMEWLESQKERIRQREWMWFLTNALASFGLLVALFVLLNLGLLLLVLLWPSLAQIQPSWHTVPWIALPLFFLPILLVAAVRLYRTRANLDRLLLEQFLEERQTPSNQ